MTYLRQSGLGLVILILLFVVTMGVSQAESPANVTINYLEARWQVDQPKVTISAYVSVTDADGQPIIGLNTGSFTVFQDGQRVEPVSLTPANDPVAVIMALDTSGSMKAVGTDGIRAIDAAKEAARTFITTLTDGDQIAVYSFNDEISLRYDLNVDTNGALNAVGGMEYKEQGGTCLYDATLQAITKSREFPQGRRAIIVLTDGVDEVLNGGQCSNHTVDDVINAATTESVKTPLFPIGVGPQVNKQELTRLANLTGGRFIEASASTELKVAFNHIATLLKNQYLLSYFTEAASGEHVVVVKIDNYNDEARVFIPSPPVLLATPTPPQSICTATLLLKKVTLNQPEPGQIEVIITLHQTSGPIWATLSVNNLTEAEKTLQPPEDRFVLPVANFEPGEHLLRVTAEDKGCPLTSEMTIPIPTPVPTVVPTTPSDPSGTFSWLTPSWFLVLAGVITVVVGIAIGVIFVRKSNGLQDDEALYGPQTDYKPSDEGDSVVTVFEGNDPAKTEVESLFNARLTIIEGSGNLKDETFFIKKSKVTIGRDSQSDIRIPSKNVSRHHAEIEFNDERKFMIKDCGSSNGTFVNNRSIGPQPTELSNETIITLGKVEKINLKFEVDPIDSVWDGQSPR